MNLSEDELNHIFLTPRFTHKKVLSILSKKTTDPNYYRSNLIDIVRSMVEDNFLRIIDSLAVNPHSGFIFLQSSMQIFELIEQYRVGNSSTSNSSIMLQRSIKKALIKWFNLSENDEVAKNLALFLAINARQGLVHELTARKVIITNQKDLFQFDLDKSNSNVLGITLNPWTFYDKTKSHFYEYLNDAYYDDKLFTNLEKMLLKIIDLKQQNG